MDFDVTYAGAVLAGILSFVSPCVLPLVLPYLCFLGGLTLDQIADLGLVGCGGAGFPTHVKLAAPVQTVIVNRGACEPPLRGWPD